MATLPLTQPLSTSSLSSPLPPHSAPFLLLGHAHSPFTRLLFALARPLSSPCSPSVWKPRETPPPASSAPSCFCSSALSPSAASRALVETSAEVQGSKGRGTARTSAAPFSREAFTHLILSLQENICSLSADRDGSGKEFIVDRWERESPTQGYGITRVLEGGRVLEKAAANVSVIQGKLSRPRAEAMSGRQGRSIAPGTGYFAAALSLVFHPAHPMVPTFRSDIRFFEVDGECGWFGGGADLTPSYLFEEDAHQFHAFYKSICEQHCPGLYPKLKATCDSYFYLPSRKEHRGVGGIFFDDLHSLNSTPAIHPTDASGKSHSSSSSSEGEGDDGESEGGASSLDEAFAFVRDVGEGFMDSYWPIVERRRELAFSESQRQWQLVRRGRYLEFNLLYDRGVRFGMDGSGRVASIMVSAPPLIAWVYDDEPLLGSHEARTLEVLRSPRTWA